MKKIPMTSLRQDWRTPRALYQGLDAEFRFDFDPCPPNPQFDGLTVEWGQRTYVNPPFKGIAKWIEKGWREWKAGKTVVFLIPARTDTRYWHSYCMEASEIRFIKGRIHYDDAPTPAPFPSCIVIFLGATANAPDRGSAAADILFGSGHGIAPSNSKDA